MNKLIIFFLFAMAAGQISGQNCTNLNFPTAIADSCQSAPFLCGNFLENYCGTNADLTDDVFGQSSGFLRLSPCEADLELQVTVSSCAAGDTGLVFRLYPEGCNVNSVLSSDTIYQNTTDTLVIPNLDALGNYLLAISGVQGSQCEFNIQVVAGMGTALPGPVDCSCANGTIEGPSKICSGQPVTYTIVLPSCFLSFAPPVGGNGEFCPPASACPASLDSFVVIWHIPSVMHFVGDSTGLDVVIALDSNYMGLDTLLKDSIWVSWQLISSAPKDTLTFCVCSGIACVGKISPKYITIGYDIRRYACALTCTNQSCEFEGVTYTTPGFFTYEPALCERVEVTVTQETPEPPIVLNENICSGESVPLFILNFDPTVTYQWSTGEIGPFITVSPSTSTVYFVTAFSGFCVFNIPVQVFVTPSTEVDLGQVGVLTCAQPCFTFQGISYCQTGNYTVQTGVCAKQIFSIGSDPSLFVNTLPPVTICDGDCFDFFGQQICTDFTATHTENCTTYVQQVIVGPALVTNLGTIGSITCSQPCFNFEGVDYCATGEYTVPNGQCGMKKFNIAFEKETINLGEVGKITCAQTCVNFEGNDYCQSGNYTLNDSCSIRKISIGEDTDQPVCTAPFPDCLPSNTHFTVAFSIDGLPPFKVNGIPILDNYFLSNPQLNGVQYAFIVEQANGCQTVVSGTYDCAQLCITDAGKLSGETLHGCAGQSTVQVQSLIMPTLSPGDVQVFALQNEDGLVITYNSTGIFVFDPSTMRLDETYYAVRSVGPPDANGVPDLTSACADSSSSQPLVFHGLPNVSLSGDSSLCEGGMLMLTASGANTYLWNDGSTGNTKEISSVAETQQGVYSAIGTDLNGCKDEDSTEVIIRPQQSEGCCRPQLPNAFTPNGDGANDSFLPILPDCNKLEFAEMRIYSRWGELVFKSTDNADRWDGSTPNGSPAGSDTYIFTFRYRLEGDGEKTQKGEITLLR